MPTAAPSFRECRRAARSIRRAQHGPEAIGAVRPRSVVWLYRSRAPLAMMLYLAGADRRLVWRGHDSLALLQPPATDRPPVRGHRLLRLIDRWWDRLLSFGPTILGVALTVVLALAGAPLAGLFVLTASVTYLVIVLAALAVYQGYQLVRPFVTRTGTDEVGAESLPGEQWSMTLCHHPNALRADELLRLAELRLTRLLTGAATMVLNGQGVRADRLVATETLVCLRSGVTTDLMRDRVLAWTKAPAGAGAAPAVTFRFMAKMSTRPVRVVDTGTFFFWYLGGVAVAIVVNAVFVAAQERAACRLECTGRPADYLSALRWLLQRLLLTDPYGLAPATPTAAAIGWLISITSIVGGLVFIVAVIQYRRYRSVILGAIRDFQMNVGRRTTVLLMVATDVERQAVAAAMRAATGEPARLRFREVHTIFELGTLSNADVLMVRTEPGAVGPSSAAITAAAVIGLVQPDYLIVTGICYGLRRESQKLGDIIVGRQLRAIDHRKVTDVIDEDGAGNQRREQVTLTRGDFVTASPALLDRFTSAEHPDGVGVHTGTLLSGSLLVDSKQLHQDLRALDPEALGGEMEGAGVYAAAARGKIDWIVVKAICDWGYDKTDEAQARAAGNVAGFVVDVIRSGALDEPIRPANLRT